MSQERKPEDVDFLKNQFPVQFVPGEGAVLCLSVRLKHWARGTGKQSSRSQHPRLHYTDIFFFFVQQYLEENVILQAPKYTDICVLKAFQLFYS